jgi:hypothetical protein
MTDATTDSGRALNMIESNIHKVFGKAMDTESSINAAMVSSVARDWAYSADFYDILLLLDVVAMARDEPPYPSTEDNHWQRNEDDRLSWMGYIRDLGDTTMRRAIEDHLGMLDLAVFHPEDDYVFKGEVSGDD